MSPGERPPLNQRAILSVGLGAGGFALLAVEPFLSMILSLPAITIAAQSRNQIRESDGAERGSELARIGLMIGCTTLLLSVVGVFLDLL